MFGRFDIRNRIWYSRMHSVEMSFLRGTCGVTRWNGESNESMYRVVEWVKNTLHWFGHVERLGSYEFVKKNHVRGRSL